MLLLRIILREYSTVARKSESYLKLVPLSDLENLGSRLGILAQLGEVVTSECELSKLRDSPNETTAEIIKIS